MEGGMMRDAYAVIHKDLNVRIHSRSGGFFTALSDYVLNHGGVVYGCILNEDFLAVHVRALDKASRDKMRGSKYIQSNMGQVIRRLMKDIADGKLVLFTGTTCQVASVKAMFKVIPENLILMDVVCHGVPSPMIWKKYIDWNEKRFSGKCDSVEFRNKIDFGWRAHIETLNIENKGSMRKISQEYFRALFYRHNILRPACYHCPYKSLNRVADISIADCWGVEKAAPQMDDNKGVSLILVETEKGERIFSALRSTLQLTPIDINKCIQPSFIEPHKEPEDRKNFWNDLYGMRFSKVLNKYADYGIFYSLQKRFKKLSTILSCIC